MLVKWAWWLWLALNRIFGDDRSGCGKYKFEKLEDVKMREDIKTIQAGDLVVVIDDNGCCEIKNGDVHQVARVWGDKVSLEGKGGYKIFCY